MNAPDDTSVWNWLVGGAATVMTLALGLIYRKAEATEAALAAHAVEDVKSYALKSDMQALREHVDGKFEALLSQQQRNHGALMDRLDRLGRVP